MMCKKQGEKSTTEKAPKMGVSTRRPIAQPLFDRMDKYMAYFFTVCSILCLIGYVIKLMVV